MIKEIQERNVRRPHFFTITGQTHDEASHTYPKGIKQGEIPALQVEAKISHLKLMQLLLLLFRRLYDLNYSPTVATSVAKAI